MIKIGFTGTRHGMSDAQKNSFLTLIKEKEFNEFHHGDCIGSDEQAHKMVETYKNDHKEKIKIHGHPPKYKKYRANCKFDIEYTPDDYLERNHNIVDATDILIATPDVPETLRSGTWATVRYAREKNKKIYIIHKNGKISVNG